MPTSRQLESLKTYDSTVRDLSKLGTVQIMIAMALAESPADGSAANRTNGRTFPNAAEVSLDITAGSMFGLIHVVRQSFPG